MDSRRPGELVELPATVLTQRQRAWRALKYGGGLGGLGLVWINLLLLFFPFPHVHLCTVPLALALGPAVGFFTWQVRVLFGAGTFACPRCGKEVTVTAGLSGWPGRLNCPHCAIMVELCEVKPNAPA